MLQPLTNVAPSQAVSQADSASKVSPKVTTSSAVQTPAYTVQISNAARQMLQETTETPAQTAKEAAGGDRQAQRLLAKEAATEKAMKP
jgi:hypothetical protein